VRLEFGCFTAPEQHCTAVHKKVQQWVGQGAYVLTLQLEYSRLAYFISKRFNLRPRDPQGPQGHRGPQGQEGQKGQEGPQGHEAHEAHEAHKAHKAHKAKKAKKAKKAQKVQNFKCIWSLAEDLSVYYSVMAASRILASWWWMRWAFSVQMGL
jgi:hypothetical protein